MKRRKGKSISFETIFVKNWLIYRTRVMIKTAVIRPHKDIAIS